MVRYGSIEMDALEAGAFRPRRESRFISTMKRVNYVLAVVGVFALVAIATLAMHTPTRAMAPTAAAEVLVTPADMLPRHSSDDIGGNPPLSQINKQAYPGYPKCQEKLEWLENNWNSSSIFKQRYTAAGVDGSLESMLQYLNQHGLFCPTLKDAMRAIIRGVNLGGWLVLEPWIKPSLFEQFDPLLEVKDMWSFCEQLGKVECAKQLEVHYDTWLTEQDVQTLSKAGITHVRIPVGYWIMGDIREGEPWVPGSLKYLQRAMYWFTQNNIHVIFDLHCGPGSQNGFDNSGKAGEIHWADPSTDVRNHTFYPNLDRSIAVLEGLVSVFSLDPFNGVVTGIEVINEAFITIPLPIVKKYYEMAYKQIRQINPTIDITIGDSFRFMSWDDFMYPPEFTHVFIDTHIYQVFDEYRLGMSVDEHIKQTCTVNLPQVAVAPLSTVVGEWTAAMTDCAKWLNGYMRGARYDGTFMGTAPLGSCEGLDNVNSARWTDEFKADTRRYVIAQMDAYEAGSSQGWFFWNFKTESAPEWNYLLGLQEGWIPTDPANRKRGCPA